MLPEIGATELLVIAAVALIVVGPKDLPLLLRKLGQFVAKMRGMANEFRASFDEMARQSELDELRREVQALRSGQFMDPVHQAAEDARDVGVDQVFADIDAGLKGGDVQLHPPMSYQIDAPAEPAPVAETPKRKRAPAKPKAAAEAAPAKKAPARKASPKKTETETVSKPRAARKKPTGIVS
ncbi:Sec-independent protein translocase protein TatB [Caulobacter mirabilis]|uniref:Sec-independent protein translocase protein TatB n=1 Tax=Caulobacter mirabilis TaxID=69666 RepID=A0A2D2AWU0_9CAUL|nr:Sec-independent protein translocase protein TatB [Caulobacter mirabilis]ATQ42463.1 twin-arginine translocase subunit TatB [Caulobacter mirabilis]